MSRYIDADKLKTRIAPESDFRHTLVEWIDLQETEDVAPVTHAHWIKISYAESGYFIGVCSHCSLASIVSLYCGKCGAKMDEEV